MVLGSVLMSIGRERKFVLVAVASTVGNVAMNLVAIPAFENGFGDGAIGASAVTVASELMMFAGALILIPKDLIDVSLVWFAARVLIAGIATVVVGTALLPVGLVFAIAGGACAYIGTVIILRALTWSDAEMLLQLALKRTPFKRSRVNRESTTV
jgi:O-antigen/teichoic acid export membrane protein